MHLRIGILIVLALLTVLPASAQDLQTSWTIAVDCASGQRINEALQQAAPFLTIDVRGLCQEQVVVLRDNVTLRGADPSRDGILAPPGAGEDSALLIRSARNVTIDGLRISGGRREGLRVTDSTDSIVISNSLLEGNEIWGASIDDSTVTFQSTVFTNNAVLAADGIGGGLIVARGSDVACIACSIELNPATGTQLGAVAFSGSTLRIDSSRVEGATAVLAQSHARALVTGSELTGASWAFQANAYGTVRVRDGQFSGPFLGTGTSTVELIGATQILNQLQNFVTDSSTLVVEPSPTAQVGSALSGLTLIADFSTGRLAASTVAEELVCALGGDVICEGSALRQIASGCGACRP